jgi:hypothetical protein
VDSDLYHGFSRPVKRSPFVTSSIVTKRNTEI